MSDDRNLEIPIGDLIDGDRIRGPAGTKNPESDQD